MRWRGWRRGSRVDRWSRVGSTKEIERVPELLCVVGEPYGGSRNQHGSEKDPRTCGFALPTTAIPQHGHADEYPCRGGVDPPVIAGEDGANQDQAGTDKKFRLQGAFKQNDQHE